MLQLPPTRRHLLNSSRGLLAHSRARPLNQARRGKMDLRSQVFSLSAILDLLSLPKAKRFLVSLSLNSSELCVLSVQIRRRHPRHGGSRHRHHSGVPMGSLRGHGAQRPGQIWNCLDLFPLPLPLLPLLSLMCSYC